MCVFAKNGTKIATNTAKISQARASQPPNPMRWVRARSNSASASATSIFSGSPGPTSSFSSATLLCESPSISDPWVGNGVQQVDDHVDQYEADRDHGNKTL